MPDIAKLLLLCGIDDEGGNAALVAALYDRALAFAASYTGREESDGALEGAVTRLVAEDFARVGSDGVDSRSVSGMRESYRSDYSAAALRCLDALRRVRTPRGNGGAG